MVRVVAGFALAIFAVASFHSLHDLGGPTVWVSVAAALFGIGLVATAAGGYCPLYARLGFGRLRSRGGLWYGKG